MGLSFAKGLRTSTEGPRLTPTPDGAILLVERSLKAPSG